MARFFLPLDIREPVLRPVGVQGTALSSLFFRFSPQAQRVVRMPWACVKLTFFFILHLAVPFNLCQGPSNNKESGNVTGFFGGGSLFPFLFQRINQKNERPQGAQPLMGKHF